ncbi:MAG: hypothetical protein ACYCQJ_14125 [Nitrososphaerales archaeon]
MVLLLLLLGARDLEATRTRVRAGTLELLAGPEAILVPDKDIRLASNAVKKVEVGGELLAEDKESGTGESSDVLVELAELVEGGLDLARNLLEDATLELVSFRARYRAVGDRATLNEAEVLLEPIGVETVNVVTNLATGNALSNQGLDDLGSFGRDTEGADGVLEITLDV